MENKEKFYLMATGTLAPALLAVLARQIYIKAPEKVNWTDMLVFAGVSLAAGYYTSKIISQINKAEAIN